MNLLIFVGVVVSAYVLLSWWLRNQERKARSTNLRPTASMDGGARPEEGAAKREDFRGKADGEGLKGKILYINYPDEVGFRRVTIESLIYRGSRLDLDAWCSVRNELRCFPIDRITKVTDPAINKTFDGGRAWYRSFNLPER